MTGRRAAAALAGIALFALLAGLVASGIAPPYDVAINAALGPLRRPDVLAAFLWITALGAEPARLAAILATSAVLWSGGRPALLGALWVTVLGSEVTTWAVKLLVDRPRPAFLPGVATALSPSFPSAHAAGTTALAGALALAIGHDRPDRAAVAWTLAVALVAAVGFSRLLLDVHFPTDVLGGALVGSVWIVLGSTVVEARPAHA